MAYLVTYQLTVEGKQLPIANKVLLNTHPLEWASSPPPSAQAAYIHTVILWWVEIPRHVVDLRVDNWCGVET